MNVDDALFLHLKKYPDLEAYRVGCGKVAECLQLNMSDQWREITEAAWNNGQCCACQTRPVRCPCRAGLEAAYEGGECHCGLFNGHN